MKEFRTYDLNEQQIAKEMVKKVTEGHVTHSSRNSKSRAESLASLQALKSELDDERWRRKELESVNRKLVQEIDEAKY